MKRIYAVLVSCLLLCGCVVGSMNPFYTDDLIVKQPDLYGAWFFTQDIEAHDESPLVFADGKITIYDDKGVPADAKATFFKVDDALFLDIFADEGRLKEEIGEDHPPVHLINRVTIIEPEKISLNPIAYDWLEKELKAGTIVLAHEKVANTENDILFTATAAQWVDFLRQHKDDPQAFPPDREAMLVRKIMSEK